METTVRGDIGVIFGYIRGYVRMLCLGFRA